MIGMNDLKNGSFIAINNDPFVVLEIKHLHMGRGGSSVQTRIRNLRTGQVLEKNYKPADQFEEADVQKTTAKFIYSHRGEFWFLDTETNVRFELNRDIISDNEFYLKPNLDIIALKFKDKIINIELPIKVDYKVVEAPPATRGNTAQGGTKTVVIESGAKAAVPLFINENDIIRINTQTGEYVERVEKNG
ncbi:MAG: elongation factor P [Patescibacteria group bacterium]